MSDFEAIRTIKDFKSLVKYLRTELSWPLDESKADSLTFEYTPEELGLDEKAAVKIEEIKQIKPLEYGQPWGIFWIEFESKRLPVTVMRRILASLVKKKRGSTDSDRATWEMQDLMFISATGEGNERGISFAHFHQNNENIPQLRTFYWDVNERHFYYLEKLNLAALRWPLDEADKESWREQWSSAFTTEHRMVIRTSKQLAERMAELAAATRDLVIDVYENERADGRLHLLFESFKKLLIHDLKVDDFADMYAQTIAYGLFLAAATRSEADFDLDHAVDLIPSTNPFLRDLLEECLRVGSQGYLDIEIDELGVGELVTTLSNTDMDAVLRDFGRLTGGEDPVIHFYETFLKEYDAEKKVQRGVFFTPWPVVSYIVRSVDYLLRNEFNLEDGLADTTTWGEIARCNKDLKIPEGVSLDQAFVQILDPACGTGTFLVEVIDLIRKTMVEKWKAQKQSEEEIEVLWNEYIPEHLLPRLHGYELLMAPYAIAHLKIGLKLYETGYRFESEERVRVYLTNALEPASDVGQIKLEGIFPALAHEAQAVNEIKLKQRFTVVVGNPPYSVSSHNKSEFIEELMNSYKVNLQRERNIQPLSDDYVKFIRLTQYLLGSSDRGVAGLITNHSYLSGVIHRTMRKSLMAIFDKISVTDLHGNSFINEHPPSGIRDTNVFEIQQGVSIFLGVRQRGGTTTINFSELWGTGEEKMAILSELVCCVPGSPICPDPEYAFFVPKDFSEADVFSKWPSLVDIFRINQNGIQTGHDGFSVAFDTSSAAQHAEDFFNGSLSDSEVRERYDLSDCSGWKFAEKRKQLLGSRLNSTLLVPYYYRPFDIRYIYYEPNLLKRPSPKIMPNLRDGKNIALFAMRKIVPTFSYTFFGVVNSVVDHGYFYMGNQGSSSCFPLYIRSAPQQLGITGERKHNFQISFSEKLSMGIGAGILVEGLPNGMTPEEIFNYAYSVFHSPTYRSRYEEFLKIDFPRLPLPSNLDLFRSLAQLGSELVALHLMKSPMLEGFITTYNGLEDSEVGRVGWSNDTVWLDAKKNKPRSANRAEKPGTIGFHGVPEEVWDFCIGGYQVCHKWLKDRKGRSLTEDDLTHYQKIIVALNETIRLMEEIDEVIETHGGWPDAFAVGEDAKIASEEKVIPFPQPGEADETEKRPLRKAAEPKEEYRADDGE